jgi:hypothetical protein
MPLCDWFTSAMATLRQGTVPYYAVLTRISRESEVMNNVLGSL